MLPRIFVSIKFSIDVLMLSRKFDPSQEQYLWPGCKLIQAGLTWQNKLKPTVICFMEVAK